MLARALYRQPRLLLLDEATSHLDVRAERQVSAAIAGLQLTRLIVAHRPETIASCDRVLVMREGSIEADGSPEAIFADAELLERCHLELPLSLQRR